MACWYCEGDHTGQGYHEFEGTKLVFRPAPTVDPNGEKPEEWFYQGVACKDPLPADAHDCECVADYGMPCGPCRSKWQGTDFWNE